jgi:hypothetical protein
MRVPKPCGTEAAYKRHVRRREVPCEPCRVETNRVVDARRKARAAARAATDRKAAA